MKWQDNCKTGGGQYDSKVLKLHESNDSKRGSEGQGNNNPITEEKSGSGGFSVFVALFDNYMIDQVGKYSAADNLNEKNLNI